MIAWQRFDDLREPSGSSAWLDRIIVNGCRDRLRRRGTVRFIPLAIEHDPPIATRSRRFSSVTRCSRPSNG